MNTIEYKKNKKMMKINKHLLLLLTVLLIGYNGFSQVKTDTLRFPKNYAESTKSIRILPETSTIISNKCTKNYCDTLYVFNKKKYSKYLLYKNYIAKNNATQALEDLSKQYEKDLAEQQDLFNRLDVAYQRQTKVHKNQMDEVTNILELNKASIGLMRQSLESANESIVRSQKLIKQQNRIKFFNKVKIAGIGIGIGTIIGVLVKQ